MSKTQAKKERSGLGTRERRVSDDAAWASDEARPLFGTRGPGPDLVGLLNGGLASRRATSTLNHFNYAEDRLIKT